MTPLATKLQDHLQRIYPSGDNSVLAKALMSAMAPAEPKEAPSELWDQQDAVLISYGDSLVADDEMPLTTLKHFVDERLSGQFSMLHLLPYFPYSSDDGFAVVDYLEVNPKLGDWSHVEDLGHRLELVTDLVINHASSRSLWFEQFIEDKEPGRHYFVTANLDDDLSAVVRPRTSELLKPVRTARGDEWVWCTFSHDQVDLNFQQPQLLLEMVRILRHYLDHGSRMIRLDAIAFLWKTPGTDCLNLPQTHEVVRLLRTLVDAYAPGSLLLTETNIPNRDNLSYFGNGNEAHLIYNFALPPLLLQALISGSAAHLKRWQMAMPPAPQGCSYLNFIASHDGIGLRPVESILSEQETQQLIEHVQAVGGRISWRNVDGQAAKAYELNVSLFDACHHPEFQLQRFLCIHAIMLSLEGIPAIYIHSLLGTSNDLDKVANTGSHRSINRHNWSWDDLQHRLDTPDSQHHQCFEGLSRLLKYRAQQEAFHPNATQFTLQLPEPLFGLWRQSQDRRQSIFAIANLSDRPQPLPLSSLNLIDTHLWRDLISDKELKDPLASLTLAPYQVVWLSNT